MSAIDDLTSELARLPGIGRKTALRLTYYLLKQPPERSHRLADTLVTLAERVRPCQHCFNLTEGDVCGLCLDPKRDRSVICVVEEASDISAIERAGEFKGLYHVLGGRLSPLDGIGPDDLTITQLERRVEAKAVREVILATNPSIEGEATALFIQGRLHTILRALPANESAGVSGDTAALSVSRIARGLPVGGDLEYADGVTIAQALAARRIME